MKLKDPSGWFAAGPRMLQALHLLSDGAFKLFAYISLTASRSTGRLSVTQLNWLGLWASRATPSAPILKS
jgi:hypothetical protein